MKDELKLYVRYRITSQSAMYIFAFVFAMAISFLIQSGTFAESFDTNVRVDDGGTSVQMFPSIVADSQGNVYAVWQDNRRTQWDIYCAKSVDGGETFGADVLVQDDTYAGSSDQKAPAMAIDENGVLYVVWQDKRNGNWDIGFAMSSDGGDTFGSNVKVNKDSGSTGQYLPDIAVDDSGNVYVVWVDNRNEQNWDIYFATFNRSQFSFEKNVRVDDDSNGAMQYSPEIAVDKSGNIYVVWRDRRSGNDNIRLAKSTNGGSSFSASVRVDDDSSNAEQNAPSIALDSTGNVYVAWSDFRNGHYDIYFAKSEDGGATFGASAKVNNTSRNAYQLTPILEIDPNGDIYVMWRDDRDGSDVSGMMDIYFASSSDTGATFAENVRVTDGDAESAASFDPVMTVGDSRFVYAAWTDNREGSNDIYSSSTATTLSTAFAAGWNMFSVPRIPVNSEPTQVFADDIDPVYLHRYNPQTGGYDMYPLQAMPVTSGAGYWMKVDAEQSVDVRGIPVEQVDHTINLEPGWNQIGEPFEFNVSWGNVKVTYEETTVDILTADANGWITKYLYWYDSSSGGYNFDEAPNGKIDAWKGYLVRAFVECELVIPPTAEAVAPPLLASSTEKQEKEWQIKLSAQGGGRSDIANFLGVASNANDDFDNFDVPEPPPLNSFMSLYFPHADWEERKGKYTRDIRQKLDDDIIKWTMELLTDLTNTEINLTWDIPSQLPKKLGILLTDQDANKTIDMRKSSQYSFNSGTKSLRHFVVAISTMFANAPPQIEAILIDGKKVGEDFVDGDYVSSDPTIEIKVVDDDLNQESSKAILKKGGVLIDTLSLQAIAGVQDGQSWKPGWLEDGKYTLEVHAEDFAGNSPVNQSVYFEVVSNLRIEKTINYPNPMQDKTEFTYMLTREAEVTIRIYTISGKLIRRIEGMWGKAGFNRTPWNGRDEDGDELANGVYLYKITAKMDDEKEEKVEKLIIMR